MKKIIRKIGKDKKGTALLTALLVMGVLLAVSMALSSLIFRETRIVGTLIDSGRAYYAAESGIEEALYYLNTELPGWEKNPGLGELSDKAVFEYKVKNKCESYPCFDEEDYSRLNEVPADKLYDVLDLNENITIPLFTVNEAGDIESVKDFTVMFFAPFNINEAVPSIATKNLGGWDVLRWKVFGMKKTDEGEYKTNAISDFTAISSLKNVATGEFSEANAQEPSWFGTDNLCTEGQIICRAYNTPPSEAGEICDNTKARDYFIYNDDTWDSVSACYPITTFMENHIPPNAEGLNYLSLTNMMNPDFFDKDYLAEHGITEDEIAKIYFRVVTDKPVVREVADITANGYSGDSKQSINVKIRRGGYMPVFNFSIYSTYMEEGDKVKYEKAGML